MAGQEESKKKKKGKGLPEHIELQRTHMVCGAEMNSYTNTFTSANVFMPMGVDNAWDLGQWKEGFRIKVNKLTSEMMEVDITGVDPAVVNALRRILIAEVPTMAIEHVFVANNTSIIQDEVLAHRLGMVPLLVDPAMFEYKTAEEAASEKNMLVFKLDITCKKQGDRLLNEKAWYKLLPELVLLKARQPW
ncbi:RPOLD domain-containing protein [Haematococcus lacustris]|uniref:Plastid-encoded RNA polymerase subunit alpha n=1 Tax=Haematococcus lacustris TaxID=44745 RepID=A0A699Y8K6_HAELA|nr:RPOLD domain-containing protein [Haematococcus lacustris]